MGGSVARRRTGCGCGSSSPATTSSYRSRTTRAIPSCSPLGSRRVAAHADLLLGPYSTQLMREAGEAMADIDGVLWNQGGAGDDVQALCPGRMVSVLAPTSSLRRAVCAHRATRTSGRRCGSSAVAGSSAGSGAGRGRPARSGRAGDGREAHAVTGSRSTTCQRSGTCSRLGDSRTTWRSSRRLARLARPPRTIGSVAAGVQDFASEVAQPDGIYGIAQWFPGRMADARAGAA